MKRFFRYIMLLVLLPVFSLCAESEQHEKEQQVLKALNETAAYISDVLINEQGYSRCDYNIPEGKWYD